jgi:cis-3-alkyl-4-acyloxetan-2-one decarboxylase
MSKKSSDLHYEINGVGPTVVLLHGFMSSRLYWSEVVKDLSRSHRVITIDLLGFGKSPKPRCSRYDLDAQLISVRSTLKQIGVSGFKLAGHSMGSLISLRYARLYPEQVKELLLINLPVYANDEEAKADVYGRQLYYRLGLHPGLHWAVWPVVKVLLRLHFARQKFVDEFTAHKTYMFQSNGAARIRSLRNLIFTTRVDDDLAQLSMKTTIFTGMTDREVYSTNLKSIGDKLSNLVTMRFYDEGHHIPRFRPEVITQVVRQS